MTERCYAEVSLGAIRENYRIYRSQLYPHQRIIAVVKADAYGHGASEVAMALSDEGCRDLAVATLEEGVALREAGIGGSVLILGYTPPHRLREALEYKLMQTVIDREYAKEVTRWAPSLPVQLAIDTGMRRAGLCPRDGSLREWGRRLNARGIYTHLAAADDKCQSEFTKSQLAEFDIAVNSVGRKLEYTHALNSAGGLLFNTGATSHIRLGILLYGIPPSPDVSVPEGVRPTLAWYATLSSTRWVERGETVGYGRGYTARRRTLIGTVEVGYADGYRRCLSGVGQVLVGGAYAPVVGRVCMDRLTVDLTGAPTARAGDRVTLIGEGCSAADMARWAGTIPYEVLTGISGRVKRIYIP